MDDPHLAHLTDQITRGWYRAKLNAKYNQQISWWLSVFDKTIRATVGLVAAVSFAYAIGSSSPNGTNGILSSVTASQIFSFLSLLAAIVLNIAPVGLYHQQYHELHRRWNDLSGRWRLLQARLPSLKKPDYATVLQEIRELQHDETSIESSETAPWMSIMKRCQKSLDRSLSEQPNPEDSEASE